MVSRHHLIAWMKVAEAEVVAIADPVVERAQARCREFGVSNAFSDVAEMIAATAPDALDIATPVETHAAALRTANEAGIAVLCQKPLTPTLAEAEALAFEVGERAPVMVHENWRFRAPYRQALDWIKAGCIGGVRRFEITAESAGLIPAAGGGSPPALVRQPFLAKLPRLVIFELLIHHLDLARVLCGDLRVVAARASSTTGRVAGEERAAILLEGAGVFGTVTGDFAVPGQSPAITDRIELVGERGTILFDGRSLTLLDAGTLSITQRYDPEETAQSGYDGAIRHFVDTVRAGRAFETNLADNLKTLSLVEQAYGCLAAGGSE
jgi:predicted dehydrogenase